MAYTFRIEKTQTLQMDYCLFAVDELHKKSYNVMWIDNNFCSNNNNQN